MRDWLRGSRRRMGRSAGGAEKHTRTGTTIVYRCEEMWRPEAKRGQKWRTWKGLDGKRWIVLVSNVGGKEGEMEEWDLIEESPRDPSGEEERGAGHVLSPSN